ncbi:MAG: fibronectin type III domain-containing protein [Eubacterium sp.]|nr:fibronectin type III domain-containing protein [Eubacterium sp.]
MKKALSLILSLLMLVSIIGGVSFNALADEVIDIVTLGIQYKPFTGGEIKQNAEIVEGSGFTVSDVQWYDKTNGSYSYEGGTFANGHAYRLEVYLAAENGYSFDLHEGEPAVAVRLLTDCAQFNEIEVMASAKEGAFPEQEIKATYDFPACGRDTVIREVSLANVVLPRPGNAPVDYAASATTGVSINDASNNIAIEHKGMQWIDSTGTVMSDTDKFVRGNNYTLQVRVKADDGYIFNTDGEDNPDVSVLYQDNGYVRVDGYARKTTYYPDRVNADTRNSKKYITLYAVFECTSELNSVSVNCATGYAFVNEKPDFTASVPQGANYAVYNYRDEYCHSGLWYYDKDAHRYLGTDDTFVKGHSYTVTAALMANQGYSFRYPEYINAYFNNNKTTASLYSPLGNGFSWNDGHKFIFVSYELGKAGYNILNATISGLNSATYTGKAIVQPCTLLYSGKTLVKDVDYKIVYTNNVNVGAAQVHIEGMGDFTGAFNTGYYISAKKITPKVLLSDTSFVYNKKVRKPSEIVVLDGTRKLVSGKDYTIKWSNKSSKNVGVYKIYVTLKGNYSGSKTVEYKIVPKGTTFKSDKKTTKDSVTLYFNKQNVQISGYEIQWATNSGFTKNKGSVKFTNVNATSRTIKKLKKNTKYYFRIRTYDKVKNGSKTVTLYSSWSKSKTVTTKKS